MRRLLTVLFPATLLSALFAALVGSGLWLRWTPRMQSLSWGLTEMVHVYAGWVCLVFLVGYLIHHLARTWGPLGQRQRILGLVLLADAAAALLTGGGLVLGLRGGPPAWIKGLHFASTFPLLLLLVWHTAVGWRPWLRQRWRRLVDGPS